MSTPLVVLAAILAIFALILIPLMMYRGGKQKQDQNNHFNPKLFMQFTAQAVSYGTATTRKHGHQTWWGRPFSI